MGKTNNKQEIMVPALRNGTVIDHIPSDKLFQVMSLLHLDTLKSEMIFGYNVGSLKMKGGKSIIKVSDRYFSDQGTQPTFGNSPECYAERHKRIRSLRKTSGGNARRIARHSKMRESKVYYQSRTHDHEV